MWKRNFIFTLAFLLLLALPYGICSAAEITTAELDRLEVIFNQLEQNNNEQSTKLEKASALLTKSESQINLLSEKLKQAEQSIILAQNSLEKANQSLQQLERENKSEKRRMAWQRNLFAGLAVYALTR